jgi:hypothetical protein
MDAAADRDIHIPTDTPAGLIGMDDLCTTQRFDVQVVVGQCQVGQALLGTHQSGGAEDEIAEGAEEVTDFAIRNAKTMFPFGGHRQDNGAEGVAGGADGVGDLFGMAALAITPATGAIAGLDVELRDDGDDGRQTGLILDQDAWMDQVGLTIGAAWGDWPMGGLYLGLASSDAV